ncbi:hypothetical protein [Bacteroides graminisolvens]|uniref:hypothetical protein n=1 Tax=Bacteroides graminisolvens TaxID=477666 RepID=UPI000410507F|nr:hypothetical protein [Bacteroides graminisolvens]
MMQQNKADKRPEIKEGMPQVTISETETKRATKQLVITVKTTTHFHWKKTMAKPATWQKQKDDEDKSTVVKRKKPGETSEEKNKKNEPTFKT